MIKVVVVAALTTSAATTWRFRPLSPGLGLSGDGEDALDHGAELRGALAAARGLLVIKGQQALSRADFSALCEVLGAAEDIDRSSLAEWSVAYCSKAGGQTAFARRDEPADDYTHRWEPGDVVMWSNDWTLAKGLPRRAWRATIAVSSGGREKRVVVAVDELRAAARAALEAAGGSAAVADALVGADVDGKPGHGLKRLGEICDALERRDARGDPSVAVAVEGSVVRVDGDGGLAFHALNASLDTLADVAADHGVAVALVTNTRSVSGRLAPVVEYLAARGLVAVACANSPAYVAAAPGALRRALGTNPVAFAAPTGNAGAPLVVDMATAAASRGDIELKRRRGELLEPGIGLDSRGEPTVDPARVLDGGAQLAFGGVKGALIALLVEVLAGGLTASDLAVDAADYHTMNRGLFVLAVKPPPAFDLGRLLAALPHVPGSAAAAARDDALAIDADLYFDIARRAQSGSKEDNS